MDEDKLEGHLPSWWGTERGQLYTSGLLAYPLWQLISLWLAELARVGFTGSKEGSQVDVPSEPGTVAVDAGGGRKVWIRPKAYRDEEGYPQAEIREHYSRTDGAIWAMLAILEGGEGTTEGKLDERALRENYEVLHGLRKTKKPMNTANERLLMLADAAAQHFHPDLDTLPKSERREIVVGFARRIHAITKAIREFQEYGEREQLGRGGLEDPALCVRAAELHDLHGFSWPEVAQRLDMRPQSPRDQDKVGHQAAEDIGKKGRDLLEQVYPEGWDEHIAQQQRDTNL